ncbi:MAG: EamA family transporter [Candidatus Thorarchaeota archaeon]|nr:EamA family transporter [Candidatus Thorarchaeota archaeon]
MDLTDAETKDGDSSRHYYKAVAQALLVTVLWASSWVIIKFGLEEIPPLTFAGLRYTIASAILMALIIGRTETKHLLQNANRRQIIVLAGYGLVFVAITQGSQFVGLDLLPAISVSLLLNLTPLIVLFLGIILLKEIPSRGQFGLILIGIGGVLLYFYPLEFGGLQLLGVIVVLIGVVSNAFSSIIGRAINKKKEFTPIVVTGVSMLFGSLVLLFSAFLVEGIQTISLLSWFYILWLSVVNTAIAFTIWNRAMRTLRAVNITIINGTMLPQIVILSIIFLGEIPTVLDWIGLLLIALSALLVQIIQARRANNDIEG